MSASNRAGVLDEVSRPDWHTEDPPCFPFGSVAWEAWNFRKRGGEITYDAFAQVDSMDGHQLHITNPDKSLTVVGIYLHARRLYILEADVPPDTPGAVHFQQSLIILDEDGKRIRYELDADGNRLFRITNRDGIC